MIQHSMAELEAGLDGICAAPRDRDSAHQLGVQCRWQEALVVEPGRILDRYQVVEPLGAHQLVTMELEGGIFRATLESDLALKPGENLTLSPRPDRVRWFDPETTQALPV